MFKRKKKLTIDSAEICYLAIYTASQAVPLIRTDELRNKLEISTSLPNSFVVSTAYELRILLICLGYFYVQMKLDEKGVKQTRDSTEHIELIAKTVHSNLLFNDEVKQLKDAVPHDPQAITTIVCQENLNVFIPLFETRSHELFPSIPSLLCEKTCTTELARLLNRTYERIWHEDYGNTPPVANNLSAIFKLNLSMQALLGHIDELFSTYSPTDLMSYIEQQINSEISAKQQLERAQK